MDARAQGLGRQTMVEQEMTRTCARPGCTEPGIIRIETNTWLCTEHVNELVNSPENIRANTAFEEMAEHLDKREAVVMTGRLARRTAHHGALAYLGTNARAHTRNSPIWQSAPSCAGVPCPAAALERICKEWCAPFGGRGVLRPAELALLKTAAELSLHCPRRHEDVIRYANTISRIMAQCGLANKHEREPIEEEPPQPPDRSATDWIDE